MLDTATEPHYRLNGQGEGRGMGAASALVGGSGGVGLHGMDGWIMLQSAGCQKWH